MILILRSRVGIDEFTVGWPCDGIEFVGQFSQPFFQCFSRHGASVACNCHFRIERLELLHGSFRRIPIGGQVPRRSVYFGNLEQYFVKRILAHRYKGIAGDQRAVAFPEE